MQNFAMSLHPVILPSFNNYPPCARPCASLRVAMVVEAQSDALGILWDRMRMSEARI